jgi:hypothetical protein
MAKLLDIPLVLVLLVPSFAAAETTTFSVMFAGKNIGHLIAETKGDLTIVDYDYKNNGRGPTMSEAIRRGPRGIACGVVDQRHHHLWQQSKRASQPDRLARLTMDSTGKGSATISKPALYVDQRSV